MTVTILYASLLALFFVFLSVRTIRMRRSLGIGLGDANNAAMTRAMRVHSNFAEYVPFSLLLLYFAESVGAPWLLMHGLGLALLTGRGLHAFGVSREPEDYRFRVAGMSLTFFVILVSAVYLFLIALLT